MAEAKRDNNRVPTMIGVDSISFLTPTTIAVNASTHAMLIEGTITIDTTGLATSAKQDTGNTSLASIDTKTPSLGQALAASSVPIVLTSAQLTTLTPLSTVAVSSLPALASGTNNIGDVDVLTLPAIPAGTNNIGDVDVLTLPALPAGNNNIGDVDIVSGIITTVSTVTAVTTLTGGGIAHDAVDSGNPHKVGFKAYSPDGTTPGTAVAEGDRTDAKADLDGRLLINDEHPRFWSYHLNTSTAQTDTSVQASPGAGFQLVITDIQLSNGAATAINMFLEETATTIWGPVYLEAINGRGYVWKGKKHVTAATALTLTTSSSTAHSVEILGYIQAV